MNTKMRKLLKDLTEKATYEETMNEKTMEKTKVKNHELKKRIKQVEGKYNEVFLEGSLKHYRKIKAITGIKTQIQLINIDDWSKMCQERIGQFKGGCC